MKTFAPIYNMVSSKFFHFGDTYPTVDEIMDSDDYIVMPYVKANDLEEVFEILNIRHPEEHIAEVNKLAKLDPFHTTYPSLHSSLSVGDIVVDITNEDPIYYYCDSCGWKLLELA